MAAYSEIAVYAYTSIKCSFQHLIRKC